MGIVAHNGSKTGNKKQGGELGPEAKKTQSVWKRGGKKEAHPPVQMKKHLIERFSMEVKKYPVEFPVFHYPLEFGTSGFKDHSPE